MKTSEKLSEYKYKAEIQPTDIPLNSLVEFIKNNQYHSRFSTYRQFIDRTSFYIFCNGCKNNDDIYIYSIFVYSPDLSMLFYMTDVEVDSGINDDGSLASAKASDLLVIDEVIQKIKDQLHGVEFQPTKNKVKIMVTAIDWFNFFTAAGKAWPGAGAKYYYFEGLDIWKKTYELQISFSPEYNISYNSSYESFSSTGNLYVDQYYDKLYPLLQEYDTSKSDILHYTMNAVGDPLNIYNTLPQAKILQPNRGDYYPRPSYLGEMGYEYSPGTYLDFAGRVGIIIPDNMEIDWDATNLWWNQYVGKVRGAAKNFVLLRYWAWDQIPLTMGSRKHYCVFKKGSLNNLADNMSNTAINNEPCVWLRRAYFMYPIAENLGFEINQDPEKEPIIFPPLHQIPSHKVLEYHNLDNQANGRNGNTISFNNTRWAVYHFYDIFNSDIHLDRLYQVDKHLEGRNVTLDYVASALRLVWLLTRLGRFIRRTPITSMSGRSRVGGGVSSGSSGNVTPTPYVPPVLLDDEIFDEDTFDWWSENIDVDIFKKGRKY